MLIKTNTRNGILENCNISILRNRDWRIISKNGKLYLEKAFEGNIFTDYNFFIEKFLDCMYGKSFSSILCGGLGLGVAPYMCESFCDTIDVIERDKDLIDLIVSANFLSNKINIFNEDVFNFIPNKKYDFILMDIWQVRTETIANEIEIITKKYSPYLNENGIICTPLGHFSD